MVSNTITSIQTISNAASNYVKYMADGFVKLILVFAPLKAVILQLIQKIANNSTGGKFIDEKKVSESISKITIDGKTASRPFTIYPNTSNENFAVQYDNAGSFKATAIIKDR